MEVLRDETSSMTIKSVYKPPLTPFSWPQTTEHDNKPRIILGDFNSHNTIWGYNSNDTDGEVVEEWAATNDLKILYSSKDKHTFSSARWKRGYNPDLAFVSSQHYPSFIRTVGDPIPKSQHRPITVCTKPVVKALESNSIPRFNFRTTNWEHFTADLDTKIATIEAKPCKYENFRNLVWEVARKHIPRGCRKTYIPCLNDEGKHLYELYMPAYNLDPFSDETIQLGDELTTLMSDERSERWKELITSVGMTRNSKKAWATIKRLDSESHTQTRVATVTPNQVANQLLQNGKPLNKEKGHHKKLRRQMEQAMTAVQSLISSPCQN